MKFALGYNQRKTSLVATRNNNNNNHHMVRKTEEEGDDEEEDWLWVKCSWGDEDRKGEDVDEEDSE